MAKLKTWDAGRGLAGAPLVVDETSMMVFPHFLALATLVTPDGQVTFRLPPVVRELIARIYRQDQIELAGRHRDVTAGRASSWDERWRWGVR